MVILYNASDKHFFVNRGDRIAQAVFAWYERVELECVESLDDTVRGDSGFGHTGK